MTVPLFARCMVATVRRPGRHVGPEQRTSRSGAADRSVRVADTGVRVSDYVAVPTDSCGRAREDGDLVPKNAILSPVNNCPTKPALFTATFSGNRLIPKPMSLRTPTLWITCDRAVLVPSIGALDAPKVLRFSRIPGYSSTY